MILRMLFTFLFSTSAFAGITTTHPGTGGSAPTGSPDSVAFFNGSGALSNDSNVEYTTSITPAFPPFPMRGFFAKSDVIPGSPPVFTFGALDTAIDSPATQILIMSGSNTAVGAVNDSGDVAAFTGAITDATSTARSGAFSFNSGNNQGTGASGSVNLQTGQTVNGSTGSIQNQTGQASGSGLTGNIFFNTGQSNTGNSGQVNFSSGNSSAGGTTGDMNLRTGDTNASGASTSGSISMITGNTFDGFSGNVSIVTGTPNGIGDSGSLSFVTGQNNSTGKSGNVNVASGPSNTGDSGSWQLNTGNSSAGNTGLITIFSGTSGSADSGLINIITGNAGLNTGVLNIKSGDPSAAGNSGTIFIESGNTTSGNSGGVALVSGPSTTGNSGFASLVSSPSDSGTSGDVSVRSGDITGGGASTKSGDIGLTTGGNSGSGNSGAIFLQTGNTAGGASGDINLTAGNGFPSGSVIITAKTLNLNETHLKSTQAVLPGTVVTANAGSSATCTLLSGTDVMGTVELVTGSAAWASGSQCDITFNVAYASAPKCVFSAANANAAAATMGIYLSKTSTVLSVNFATADTAATTYQWDYHCEETN